MTIVVDMLADIFGYDKYSEITSEHAIRGTFCALATKIDGALQLLIEVFKLKSLSRKSYVCPEWGLGWPAGIPLVGFSNSKNSAAGKHHGASRMKLGTARFQLSGLVVGLLFSAMARHRGGSITRLQRSLSTLRSSGYPFATQDSLPAAGQALPDRLLL